MFALEYPIVLAPMASVSGDPAWLRNELSVAKAEAARPWGVGLITWHTTKEVVELALRYEPQVFMLSFGDPQPCVSAIKAAGCTLMCQVQDVEGARAAKTAGADFIVAQGTEAGGHGASRATLPLVPAVVDAVAPTPVLAAGGIADGRGLAAALMLGAQGALIGTRFYASAESLGHQRAKESIVGARGGDTRRTRVFDVVRGHQWPEPYTGRALRNSFLERWDGREDRLASALDTEGPAFQEAVREGDFDTAVVWAGEAVDLIADVVPAAELVRRIGSQAEASLRSGSELVDGTQEEGAT
jgi:nitronate monooxygenase